jgi:hypothetical protein
MLQAELDGVVITEHDAYWTEAEKFSLRNANPKRRLYFGVEISARDGHVLAIGAKIPIVGCRERSIDSIAEEIDSVAGCAIWVHPFQAEKRWSVPAKRVHAVEVRSTVTFGKLGVQTDQLAASMGVVRVAGSDAHAIDHLGTAGVVFRQMPEDESELAGLIRRGKVRPFALNSNVTW